MSKINFEDIIGMKLNAIAYDGHDVLVDVTDNDDTKYQVVISGSQGEDHRLLSLRPALNANEVITDVDKTCDEVIITTEKATYHIQAEGESDDGEATINGVTVSEI